MHLVMPHLLGTVCVLEIVKTVPFTGLFFKSGVFS